jgi:nitroreductase family protein
VDQPITASPVEHTAAIPPDPAEELPPATRPPGSDLYDVMSTMRAMRRLRPEPVPRELIERLIQAASWAPSGGNSQTTRYIVVDDRTQTVHRQCHRSSGSARWGRRSISPTTSKTCQR